jgi:glycerol-3-phosphate acyltransferase PlsX
VIIGHGSSNANAVKNAIRVAAEFAERKINTKIEAEIAATRGRIIHAHGAHDD